MPTSIDEVVSFVQETIVEAIDEAAFRDVLYKLMGLPGRALSKTGPPKFPQFVLTTAHALGGSPQAAVAAAAAVEFVIVAADIIDDVVDGDWRTDVLDTSRALNATLALTSLAQRCILRLSSLIPADQTLLASQLLTSGLTYACSGEDLDLRLESNFEATEEVALEMTKRKAGSLVAMACQVGAAIATVDTKVIDLVGRFGQDIGIVAQLLNDLEGIDLEPARRTGDLKRRKKTIPICYALRAAKEEGIELILEWFRPGSVLEDSQEQLVASALLELGALHYTWLLARHHRRRALTAVLELQTLTGCQRVTLLRHLVPTVGMRYVQESDLHV